MNEKGQNTSVNRAERTEPIDLEKTVTTTPHFDAAAVEQARPAVPLSQLKQGRHWSTPLLIAIAIGSGLAGGFIGGLLPTLNLKDEAAQTVAAQQQQAPVEDAVPGQSPSNTVTPATVEDSSTPAASDKEDERVEALPKDTEASLRSALKDWVAATNARDIERQMLFYNPVVEAFYQSRSARGALRD